MNTLLIYGGSFNPPHLGHLKTAIAVQQYFGFQHFIFLPCKASVLKTIAPANPEDRVNMLALLLKDHPEFTIDVREINRDSPSYMVETLTSFRHDLGQNASITLLLGMDTFLTLNQWCQWQLLPSLCNLLVIKRPGVNDTQLENLFPSLPSQPCQDLQGLLHTACGKWGLFDAGLYPISSTEIRELVQQNVPSITALPDEIYQYIRKHHLYQQ